MEETTKRKKRTSNEKYKLTPFEKLQVEKERLREERETAEKRMLFQFRYIADNWGMVITKASPGVKINYRKP